jgi:hypothetical protein
LSRNLDAEPKAVSLGKVTDAALKRRVEQVTGLPFVLDLAVA